MLKYWRSCKRVAKSELATCQLPEKEQNSFLQKRINEVDHLAKVN